MRSAASPPRGLPGVLADVARIAAESLDLQQVLERMAACLRPLVPFDDVGVVRMIGVDGAILHASTAPCAEERAPAWRCGCRTDDPAPRPLDDWSPRLRPRPEAVPPILEARDELDPSFPIDAEILRNGVRSALWEPILVGGRFAGGVWLSSSRPGVLTSEHQALLEPFAAILGAALEHWRLWDELRRRTERLESLESLLGQLAGSLDVREILDDVSAGVQPLLPHDGMAFSERAADTSTFRVLAGTGPLAPFLPPGPITLGEGDLRRRIDGVELIDDIPARLPGDSESERVLLSTGMRSFLRVPLTIAGEERGGLLFLHAEPGRFRSADLEIARRVADRIALVISHARLAEEARLRAEARERALRLEETVDSLAAELRSRDEAPVVGVSPAWRDVLRQIERVAAVETTVLVTGESGTGKEVVARLLHSGSRRASRPLVALNCAAVPEQLLESELFGHEKGAFTGAAGARVGRIEQAAGGTLFLDEIGEMSPLLQAKLLRVLQEREFQRLGGTRTLRADVRVVAATHRDLPAAIARGDFREDLYYRLNVFEIEVPPLRERPEDVLALSESFLEELGRSVGRPAAGISRDARDWLVAYHWPGNVRELRNAIERAILLCDGGLITRDHLPAAVGRPEPGRLTGEGILSPEGALPAGGVDFDSIERTLVEKALASARGNRSRAARLLGITRSQLYTRLARHGLEGPEAEGR